MSAPVAPPSPSPPDPLPHRPNRFLRRVRVFVRRVERRFGMLGLGVRSSENAVALAVAALIGILAGFGSVLLRELIFFIQRHGYGESNFSVAFIEGLPWWMKLAVPTVGGLGVGILVRYLAAEAKGHGVPEVMEAVAIRGGMIRKRVTLAKILASALCIGTGGSTGREGPIVQIGASIGSTIGRYVSLNPQRVKVYVACGAAAGIASAFNAPLAGAIFAAEIILTDFAVPRLGPVIVSSVAATAVSRSLLGDERAFHVPVYELRSAWEFAPYLLLGVGCALAAVAFIDLLYLIEDRFDRSRIPAFARPAVGGLAIGLLSLAVPQVLGIGYEGITHALLGRGVWYVLLGLLAAKLVATSITLGSGGSGGIFAPSLFIGATLGGAVGHIAHSLFPDLIAPPGAYALVGMGGMVAAATHAPITAILILFELTGSYKIILPLMLTCIGAVLLSTRIHRESIYTEKLIRRGLDLKGGREMNVLRATKVREVMKEDVDTVGPGATMGELLSRAVETPRTQFFVRDDDDRFRGVIQTAEVRRALFERGLDHLVIALDLLEPPTVYLVPDDSLDQAMRLFGQSAEDEIPVVDPLDRKVLVGMLTRADCIRAYNRAIVRLDAAGEVAFGTGILERTREFTVSEGYRLVETEAPAAFRGRNLRDLELPKAYGVQVLMVRRPDAQRKQFETVHPRADLRIQPGDRLVIAGAPDALARFQGF